MNVIGFRKRGGDKSRMGAELLTLGRGRGPASTGAQLEKELFGWGWWSIKKGQWEPADGRAAFLVGD